MTHVYKRAPVTIAQIRTIRKTTFNDTKSYEIGTERSIF